MRSDAHDERRHHLDQLASSVADHQQVDWPSAVATATDDQLTTVRGLRLISQISRAIAEVAEEEIGSTPARPRAPVPYDGETWGPLVIEEKIGAGSFGEVFRAFDPNLQRTVALKLYYLDRASDYRSADDLLGEGRLLARIKHGNVAMVHGAESHAGRVGIWMEYIEGVTLEAMIADRGCLEPAEAMQIGHDVCRALTALHAAGIIHRDVKPSNIMRSEDGRIVLMDLGVSRDMDDADSEKLYGTPLYVAPEVLLDGISTPRSDLYSVGVLLYHLATGEYPVPGASLAEISAGHREGRRRPLREVGPDLPESFATIVERSLAADPAERSASADDLAQALASAAEPPGASRTARHEGARRDGLRRPLLWMAGVALALLVLASLMDRLPFAPWQTGDADDTPRIVVTFFENRTGDESLDLIGITAADWIIKGLSRMPRVHVVPTTTVLQATRSGFGAVEGLTHAALLATQAEAVAATIIVSGAFYLEADSLRFAAEIKDFSQESDPSDPPAEKSARDEPLVAIDALRERIMGALASYLGPSRAWQEDPENFRYTMPPRYEAYREFVAGIEDFGRNYDQALVHFQRAAELDSTFLTPRFWACGAYANRGQHDRIAAVIAKIDQKRGELTPFGRIILDYWQACQRGETSEANASLRQAETITPKDLTINYLLARGEVADNDPRRAVATLARVSPTEEYYRQWLGSLHFWLLERAFYLLSDYEQELAVLERCREYHPQAIWIRFYKVRALAALDRAEEVDAVIAECLTMPYRPTSPAAVMCRAAAEFRWQGQPEQSRIYAERAITWCREQPDPQDYRPDLAEALRLAGRWTEARELFAELSAESPDDLNYRGKLGTLAVRLGDVEGARAIRDELADLDRPYMLGKNALWCAAISAELGEREEATALLRQAFAEGLAHDNLVTTDMSLVTLRGYPPYQQLIQPRS